MSTLNKHDLQVYLSSYLRYRQVAKTFKTRCTQGRLPNFPEVISENLVRSMVEKRTGQTVIWLNKEGKKKGDLICDDKIFEVKCFSQSSYIPATFSPQAYWDELYILDASECETGKFHCLRYNLPSNHPAWLALPTSQTETVADKVAKGLRPRISPAQLLIQIPSSLRETIFDGYLSEL